MVSHYRRWENGMGKAFAVSCATQATFEGAREENETRDMDLTEYSSPQVVGVYPTAKSALASGIHETMLAIEEMYDTESEGDMAELKELRGATEWVQVLVNAENGAFTERPIDHSCPMEEPMGERERPSYIAALIRRNPQNREQWDFEGCVVVQEFQLDESTAEPLAKSDGAEAYAHYLEEFEIFRDTGRCVVQIRPMYKKGTHAQVGLALTHRLCSELLADNVGMKENLGFNFRGSIYVDTMRQSPETGYIIMEGADREDLEAAVTLAEFVHEGTELMV